MSRTTSYILAPAADPRQRWRIAPGLPVLLELGKARLSLLVVCTAGVGFLLAANEPDWLRLAWTVLGTALAALGANALNQWLEAGPDGRMDRTRGRPLPSGRLNQRSALLFGLATGLTGPALLALLVNPAAAALALTALLVYVVLYTPLKPRTPANTLVGAVVGALPPLVGWVAAAGTISAGGWILAGTLFLWQVPHFLALAWLYRDDYARGGFRMLPAVDPGGRLTGFVVVLYCLVLIPLTTMLTLVGVAGELYAVGALALGAALTAMGFVLQRRRTAAAARRLFLASIAYLPLLLGLMVIDRQPPPAAEVRPNLGARL